MPIRLFNNYLHLRILALAAAEVAVIVLSVYAAVAIRMQGDVAGYVSEHGAIWPKASVKAAVCFVVLLALGLYQFNQRLYFTEVLSRLLAAVVLSGFPLGAIWFMFPAVAPSRGVAVIAAVLSFAVLVSVRWVFFHAVEQHVFRRRILVYGTGQRACAIRDIRRQADRRGFRIVGNVQASGTACEAALGPVLPHDRPLLEMAREHGAEEIVVALDDQRGKLPVDELLQCKLRGVEVLDLVAFLERELGKIRIDLVKRGWLIFSSGFRISPVRQWTKRVFDLVLGSIALVLSLPLMLFSVFLIKREDGPGAPVFYRQQRVGLHGDLFEIIKFRSMVPDAEKVGEPRWASPDDPRVTRAGRIIRKLRFDELPQLINVLRGDMSLVGPRPERPEFVEELARNVPYYAERHTVKPGITGWAQLRYQYGASEHDAIEKLQFELYYVKNHSLLLDTMIILQTIEVILWAKGAR